MKAANSLHLLFLIAMFSLTACSTTSVAKRKTTSVSGSGILVRISEIEILPGSLRAYNAILKEEAEASVRLEPGVISIFPMYQQTDSTQIRILEIYASKEAYQSHIKTPHFLHYKTTTLSMVKALRLIDMYALDVETMTTIFKKLKK
jgi:4-carboxymuconolactone decarboxylase